MERGQRAVCNVSGGDDGKRVSTESASCPGSAPHMELLLGGSRSPHSRASRGPGPRGSACGHVEAVETGPRRALALGQVLPGLGKAPHSASMFYFLKSEPVY